jgi:ketosteroid isomerase-like protein
MSTAKELLLEFLDCLRNLDTSMDRAVSLFAEDGVWELPYFPTIGIDRSFEGRAAIRGALELVRAHFSSFALSGIDIHASKDDNVVFVEYHSDGFVDGTDRLYAQDYVTKLVMENGKIKLLREYLNIIATARMLLPQGLASVPDPQR